VKHSVQKLMGEGQASRSEGLL